MNLEGISNPGWSFTEDRIFQLIDMYNICTDIKCFCNFKTLQDTIYKRNKNLNASKIRMFFPFLFQLGFIKEYKNISFIPSKVFTEKGRCLFSYVFELYLTTNTNNNVKYLKKELLACYLCMGYLNMKKNESNIICTYVLFYINKFGYIDKHDFFIICNGINKNLSYDKINMRLEEKREIPTIIEYNITKNINSFNYIISFLEEANLITNNDKKVSKGIFFNLMNDEYGGIKMENKTKEIILKLYNTVEDENNKVKKYMKIDSPHQLIYYGAPGTGKSYTLNKDVEKEFKGDYERVTFYPNYQHGSFIGSYKPFPKIDNDGKECITYKFVHGVLMRLLVQAYKYPNKNYCLVIEEINRANVSAVFGHFFQLLDRNEEGVSEFPVSITEEVVKYLDIEANTEGFTNYSYMLNCEYGKIYLPSNFYIWATMNSADQGVMPMDTAFKRRWDFKYFGINDAIKIENKKIIFEKYIFECGGKEIRWNDFRESLNKLLLESNIPEDKLLGPYFISKNILECGEPNKLTEVIKNKVIMYIYEDVGRSCRGKIFNQDKGKTYSELCDSFDTFGCEIFKDLTVPNIENKKPNYNNSTNNFSADNNKNSSVIEKQTAAENHNLSNNE